MRMILIDINDITDNIWYKPKCHTYSVSQGLYWFDCFTFKNNCNKFVTTVLQDIMKWYEIVHNRTKNNSDNLHTQFVHFLNGHLKYIWTQLWALGLRVKAEVCWLTVVRWMTALNVQPQCVVFTPEKHTSSKGFKICMEYVQYNSDSVILTSINSQTHCKWWLMCAWSHPGSVRVSFRPQRHLEKWKHLQKKVHFHHNISFNLECPLNQWSPTFFASHTGFISGTRLVLETDH